MIGFDTSGSMTTKITSNNSCGYNNDRNGHARCALRNMLTAFAGEVNFGLASYPLAISGTSTSSCGTDLSNIAGCAVNPLFSTDNDPTTLGCGSGTGTTARGANILVPLQQDDYWDTVKAASNVPQLLKWVDNDCSDCRELWAKGGTPLNGLLRDLDRYLSSSWSAPTGTPTFNTPLTGTERTCRSVNIILLTDGEEWCDPTRGQDDPTAAQASLAAAALYSGWNVGSIHWHAITNVIAFGNSVTGAQNIATAGHGVAQTATDEQQLSAALAGIISAAILPETCNNKDDNCNGCTDEGWQVWCNRNKTPRTIAQLTSSQADNSMCCNDVRANCLAKFAQSIDAVSNPEGDKWFLPCWDPATSTAAPEASWICSNPGEVCDNADNNCETTIDKTQLSSNVADEGFNKCPNCPVPEKCDGIDNDCNGAIDDVQGQSCQKCIPTAEVCDGCDNDCDGDVDEGIAPVSCGLPSPASCLGTKTCIAHVGTGGVSYLASIGKPPGSCIGTAGQFSACSNSSSPEVCDGIDNDCDGVIDDSPSDVGGPCTPTGTEPTIGTCKAGTWICQGGKRVCDGYVGPTTEVCDGLDNDCDGKIDADDPDLQLPTTPCGDAVGVCQKGTWICDLGQLRCFQPEKTVEVCNGKDDNCDGIVDNDLTDVPADTGCWTDVDPTGSCGCSAAGVKWCPPPGATCTTLGSLSGAPAPCRLGTLTCAGVDGWVCKNAVEPGAEICDGTDNDCDGTPDNNLPTKYNGSTSCGVSNTLPCKYGALECLNGVDHCKGEIDPSAEVCDGIDNDCDGVIDDGIPLGSSCSVPYDHQQYPDVTAGTDRTGGLCRPGTTECGVDPTSGQPTFVCKNGVGPTPEVCDGIDNDCDGKIDELGDPPDGIWGTVDPQDPTGTRIIGAACGSDVGQCTKGTYQCVRGHVTCVGGRSPQPEICDCQDNDCDGQIDETADTSAGESPVCSPGKVCVDLGGGKGCQCAAACESAEFPCPAGFTCDTKTTLSGTTTPAGRVCVRPATCSEDCAKKTVLATDGTLQCAPSGTQNDASRPIPECVCKGFNGCHDPCFGVTCPSGQACIETGPLATTCHEVGDCYLFGCTQGNICVSGACVKDPCEPNPCAANQVCRPNAPFDDHVCTASCAGVKCSGAELCVNGACKPTGCAQACAAGEVCLTDSSGNHTCGKTACDTVTPTIDYCADGTYCDPATHACGTSQCAGVHCPTGQLCAFGQCIDKPSEQPDAGPPDSGAGGSTSKDGGTDSGHADAGVKPPVDNGFYGLASGGGGCACHTSGDRGSQTLFGLSALALAVAIWRRRRRSKADDRMLDGGDQ